MKQPTKILFVCLGNICRSPMAETIMQQRIEKYALPIITDSAGISAYHQGEPSDARMRQAALRRGYNICSRSRQITVSDFDAFDLIFAMDNSNFDDLIDLAPTVEHEKKIRKIGSYFQNEQFNYIPDPYYGGVGGFDLVIDLLEEAVDNIIDEQQSPHTS